MNVRTILSNHKMIVKAGIAFLVIAIVLISVIAFRHKGGKDKENLIANITTVEKGNIQSTITGSGTLTPSNRVTLSSPGNTTITKLPFKVGDTVKKGQLVFALDDTEAAREIFKNQDSLSDSEGDLESKQSLLSRLNIIAPSDGIVTNISISTGENIQSNSPVLTLTDNSTYKLSTSFNDEDAKNIQVGDNTQVYIQSLMSSVAGNVSYIGNTSYATSSGGKLRDVDILIKNPGSLEDGMEAAAEVTKSGYSFTSANSGKLTCKTKYTLRCEAGGTVKSINVRQNQYVHKGQLLISVKNDDLTRSVKTDKGKLKTQKDELKYFQGQKEKYIAYAPIDGEIVEQKSKLGDSVKQGDTMVVIADVSKMEFSVPIDELDIAKVHVGQRVNVTVDALQQTSINSLPGVVSKIAPEGKSSNGVSTYPVTISVLGSGTSDSSRTGGYGENTHNKVKDKTKENPASLISGMNANAEIIISGKSNVLSVPLEAIQKFKGKSYVMVKSTKARINKAKKEGKYVAVFSNNNKQLKKYYSTTIPAEVKTGVNNERMIEIVSGLEEGQKIMLPPIANSAPTLDKNLY